MMCAMKRAAVPSILVAVVMLAVAVMAEAQQPAGATADAGLVTGVVHDANGVVPNATVIVRSGSGSERQTRTGADGRFSIAVPAAGQVVVIVQAPGFGEARQTLAAGDSRHNLDIKISPNTVRESVTVTGADSVVDVYSSHREMNLSGEVVRSVPTARTYNALLVLVPGVVTSSNDTVTSPATIITITRS